MTSTTGKGEVQSNATCTGQTVELFDEVNFIYRRLEFMEEQSDQRQKIAHGGHEHCRREVTRLELELQDERESRSILIKKKNAEVAYFKAELDALLSEIQSTAGSTAGSTF